jgi:hypothetical protein
VHTSSAAVPSCRFRLGFRPASGPCSGRGSAPLASMFQGGPGAAALLGFHSLQGFKHPPRGGSNEPLLPWACPPAARCPADGCPPEYRSAGTPANLSRDPPTLLGFSASPPSAPLPERPAEPDSKPKKDRKLCTGLLHSVLFTGTRKHRQMPSLCLSYLWFCAAQKVLDENFWICRIRAYYAFYGVHISRLYLQYTMLFGCCYFVSTSLGPSDL